MLFITTDINLQHFVITRHVVTYQNLYKKPWKYYELKRACVRLRVSCENINYLKLASALHTRVVGTLNMIKVFS
jgi:hypothetical protein